MNHTKKYPAILVSFLLTFLLSGCFSFGGTDDGTQTPKTDETTKLYDGSAFQIVIPKDWEVIDRNEFTSEVPAETIVTFRNNVKNETWTAVITVVEKNLQEPLSSLDFAKMVNTRESGGLTDYRETRKEETKITVGDRQETTLFTAFEARKAAGEKLARYLQTYVTKGNKGYIVLGSFSPQENDATMQAVEKAVQSFMLK